MRRGFAILELPFAFLFLVAIGGVALIVWNLNQYGEMTRAAWAGAGLIVPFALTTGWLIYSKRTRG